MADWTGAMPHDFEWAPYVVPGLRVPSRSFQTGDTALYTSDEKVDLGAIETKPQQRVTVIEVEPPEVGTLGASGDPAEKQGVTIRFEDGSELVTVMSCLSPEEGGADEESPDDASGQSDTPTPPELGVWERVVAGGDEYIREHMMHHIEFQTLRRLSKERDFILFTVKRAQDPVSAVEEFPGAATALAAAIRRKNKSSLLRNGLGVEANGTALLGYLDRVSANAGLQPGLVPGIPEPWQRGTLLDGTKHSLAGAGPRESWKDDV